MKIVVLDGYTENPGDLSWEGLEALGSLTVYDRTPADKVAERIGDAQAVYTNKTPITAETIRQCPGMKFIGVLATGYNVIDTAAAKEQGVVVSNIPTYGTDAVAQYAMALLMELCNHACRNGIIKEAQYPFGRGRYEIAQIAQAFGMKILAFDEYPNKALETENCRYVSLDQLLAQSDVISLHCPLFPSTQGIINKDTIAKMKDGVKILNTSRGPLIVEEDLKEALNSGKVSGAAVDVVSSEPIREDNPLLGAKNMIITPHIAWAPRESRQRLMDIAVDNLRRFVDGKPQNVVNR